MKPQNTLANKSLADFKVGVDNVIFSVDTQLNRLLVLLIKRREEPFSNYWSLPGTLVRNGESLETAAYRILAEKISVNNLYLEQLYTFSSPEGDSPAAAASFGERYLSVSYFALVRFEEAKLITERDYNITWYMIDKVPDLAFNHGQILEYGWRKVLPELFTLNDLYQFYETILGKNFSDYSNFRNRLLKLGFLKDMGLKVSRGAGRPASLYRFDEKAFAPFKEQPLVFV